MRHLLHTVVRIAEVIAIIGLSIFAFLTYRELSTLRQFPVSLPSYEFEVRADPTPGGLVQTRGTWISERGTPEPLLTTSIECRKARMECTESAAKVIFLSGKGLLESAHTAFEVDRWTDAEIVTKPATSSCMTRHLVLDLKEKRAIARVAASQEKGACKEQPARTLELVNGYKVRAAPL
jgi:hypothetical protein